jgi:nitroreductase
MKTRSFTILLAGLIILPIFGSAQEITAISLPAPQTDGGRPLMQVLKDRQSTRSFKPDTLSNQALSNLLWAAFGINRPESGRRTAPSARNWQDIDIYVALAKGMFLYDAAANILKPIVPKDLRSATGGQPFVAEAPVNLVYVSDYAKLGDGPPESKIGTSNADAGFIAQHVYLFCASEGLATVVRGGLDRTTLSELMQLKPDQKIVLAQTVGYPKSNDQ